MSTDTYNDSGTQAVIDAATRAAAPVVLDQDERFHHVVSPDGTTTLYDLDAVRRIEKAHDRPHHKTGVYAVHDADSFVTYLNKHGDADSEVWADTIASKVTGVLNAHGDGGSLDSRFEDHRVVYAVQLTDAWKAWAGKDGKLLSQGEFAEQIEDRAIDIVSPAAADMLELAQTFQATIGVNFESSKRLSSGERQLEYRETVDAKAGKAGRMEIPETFILALIPFEGAEPYKVTARLRYRITDGDLRIGFKLERPADVLRESFLGVVGQIQGQVDQPILRGTR